MGSRLKIELAYIAGFLDGDGSLMLQVKKRYERNTKWRFMATVCFYQDSRHDKDLFWIRKVFGIGYFSKRNDGISELRINGYAQIERILKMLLPFIRFKRIQARALYSAMKILNRSKARKSLSSRDLTRLVTLILLIQSENYITKKKKTREELSSMLGLTP